jgi:hypothetical protein
MTAKSKIVPTMKTKMKRVVIGTIMQLTFKKGQLRNLLKILTINEIKT